MDEHTCRDRRHSRGIYSAEAVEIGSKEDHRLHNKRRSRMRDIICVFAVSVHRVFDRLVARACDRTLRHSRRRNNNRLLFRSLKARIYSGANSYFTIRLIFYSDCVRI